MYKSYSMELAGRTLRVDIGRVAAQANHQVVERYIVPIILREQRAHRTVNDTGRQKTKRRRVRETTEKGIGTCLAGGWLFQ